MQNSFSHSYILTLEIMLRNIVSISILEYGPRDRGRLAIDGVRRRECECGVRHSHGYGWTEYVTWCASARTRMRIPLLGDGENRSGVTSGIRGRIRVVVRTTVRPTLASRRAEKFALRISFETSAIAGARNFRQSEFQRLLLPSTHPPRCAPVREFSPYVSVIAEFPE